MFYNREDFDPQAPQREAAMFYGLFLRGHSADDLRKDIDIPRELLEKYLNTPAHEEGLKKALRRTYIYRKQVLRIFEELITNQKTRARLQ